MGDARAEAQRSFERDGVHDLAAAGCLEHVLHRLGLLPNPDENRDVGKVEVAFKKALARNHPDRSASRGDDVRAGARCEEAFKLLQAAKARWDAAGKPVGPRASQTAASVLGVSTHYGYPQQQQHAAVVVAVHVYQPTHATEGAQLAAWRSYANPGCIGSGRRWL